MWNCCAVISGRNVQVLRNVIALTVTIDVLTYLVFQISGTALEGSAAANPLGVPSQVFDQSLRIVVMGGILIILELVAFVTIPEQVKGRLPSWAMVPIYPLVYVGILSLDGVVFPLILDIPSAQLGDFIANSTQAKAIMGLVFAIPMLVFVLAYRPVVTAYEATPLPLRDLVLVSYDQLWSQANTANATLAGIMRSPSNALLVVLDPAMRVVAGRAATRRWLPIAAVTTSSGPVSSATSQRAVSGTPAPDRSIASGRMRTSRPSVLPRTRARPQSIT